MSRADTTGPECLDDVLPADTLDDESSSVRRRVERFEHRLVGDARREYGNTRDVARMRGLGQSSVMRKLRRGKQAQTVNVSAALPAEPA